MPGIGGLRFRQLTGRGPVDLLEQRRATGREVLDLLDAHLAAREWLVGDGPTIADVSVWAYGHLAGEAGFPVAEWPAFAAWVARARALPGWVDDLAPYAPNAWPGAGRSIYG